MSQVHGTPFLGSFKVAATVTANVIVKPGTAANQVAIWDTATAFMIGVSQQASSGGTGTSVAIALGGCAKLTAGASVSSGAAITGQTTTGYGIEDTSRGFIDTTSATVPYAIGIALDAGDTNSVFEVLIMPRNIRFVD